MQTLTKYISHQYAPRWLILGIDSLIVIFSFVLATVLRYNFNLSAPFFNNLLWITFLVFLIRLLTFIFFKTYSGIIRFTSLEDGKRIFQAIVTSSLLLFTLNVLFFQVTKNFLIPSSILIIDFLATISIMFGFRVGIKVLYHKLLKQPQKKHASRNVLIYGAGKSGLITKHAIETDGDVNYNLVGFVDDDREKRLKRLEGLTIYHTAKDLESVIQHKAVDLLIFSIQEIAVHTKQQTIEWCLQKDIEVKSVPPANRWINGELSSQQIQNVEIEDLLERDPIHLDRKEIYDEITDQHVLVTGASGSIGSELVRQLIPFQPAKLILLDCSESGLHDLFLELKEKLVFKDFEIVIGDVRDKNRVERIMQIYQPRIIFHAAAYKHVPVLENNPSEAVFTNVYGTKTMADMAVRYNVHKFILISTDKAVNPTNVMGASKRIAEMYVQSLNHFLDTMEEGKYTRFITTRFGNVLGSSGSVIPRFRKQIEEGGPVTVTHANISRYFMTIPEACQLVLEAGYMGKGSEIFLFDMGQSVRIYDLARKMIKLSGFEPETEIPIKFSGLRPGEKLTEEVLSSKENSLPTHHAKITIAAVEESDFEQIAPLIDELIHYANNNGDNYKIVKQMKTLVPEYKSQNSAYQVLDGNDQPEPANPSQG